MRLPFHYWNRLPEDLARNVWIILAVVVIGRSFLMNDERHAGIYHVYTTGGENWAAGRNVYPAVDGPDVFRYAPGIAAAFVPFSMTSLQAGSFVFRLLSVAFVLHAAIVWVRSNPGGLAAGGRSRAVFLLLLAPLVAWDLVAGQTNALIGAFMLRAADDAGRGRWWRAAAWMVPPCLLKLYPIAFALLLIAVHLRPLWWRFPVALAVGVALPFLFQEPGYVARQYAAWGRLVASDDGRQGAAVSSPYRDVRSLFRTHGFPIPAAVFVAIQLGGAALAAALCLAGTPEQRRWRAVALGGIWMTVIGPATEGITYSIAGPALAWCAVGVMRRHPGWVVRVLVWSGYLLLASSFVAYMFPFGSAYNALGVAPLGGLLFAVGYLMMELNQLAVSSRVRRLRLKLRVKATARGPES